MDYTAMTDTLCRILWYDKLPDMSREFIRQRAVYEKNRRESSCKTPLDFAGFEAQQSSKLPGAHREIALILQDMSSVGICGNGGSRLGVLNQASTIPLYDRILHIVQNTIAIYRSIYEPYLQDGETICWCPISEEEKICAKEYGLRKENWNSDSSQLINTMFSDIFQGNDLGSRGDFSGAILSGIVLYDADLRGASLIDVDLYNAKLSGVNMCEASLRDANLTNTDLSSTDFCSADLNSAILFGADLTGADLTDANLTKANLVNTCLYGTTLPDGFHSNDSNCMVEHLKTLNIVGLRTGCVGAFPHTSLLPMMHTSPDPDPIPEKYKNILAEKHVDTKSTT